MFVFVLFYSIDRYLDKRKRIKTMSMSAYPGLTEPIVTEPPPPPSGGIFALVSKKAFIAALAAMAVVGVIVAVVVSDTSGYTGDANKTVDAELAENTTFPPALSPIVPTTIPVENPVVSPVTSPVIPTTTPTASPTKSPSVWTAIPTKSPTKPPTEWPTVPPSPTNVPTFAPTISPTKAPTGSPTRGPTNGPTLSPTRAPIIDVTQKNNVTNCTQDVFMFIDASKSISKAEQTLERVWTRMMIDEFFAYRTDLDSMRVGISYFHGKLVERVNIASAGAVDADTLKQSVKTPISAQWHTNHPAIFDYVRSFREKGQPKMTTFNGTTGRGMSLIIMTDGEPKLKNKNFKTSKEISINKYHLMKEAFPSLKVFCFTPNTIQEKHRDYFGLVCDGFWSVASSNRGDATSDQVDVTRVMSSIAASKVCSTQIVNDDV